MRTTNVTPEETAPRQEDLDVMWGFIENHYEEEWRVEANGDLTLEVDGELLEEILSDNYAEAWFKFGTWAGGRNAEGESFLLDMPLRLIGEYIIKGVYNANQRLVNGEREYFFLQG